MFSGQKYLAHQEKVFILAEKIAQTGLLQVFGRCIPPHGSMALFYNRDMIVWPMYRLLTPPGRI